MKIQLSEGVFWNTDTPEQSEEARAWIRENVLGKMGMSANEEGVLIPEVDNNQRPCTWRYDGEDFSIVVTREYVDENSPSWAMKKDCITVLSKE